MLYTWNLKNIVNQLYLREEKGENRKLHHEKCEALWGNDKKTTWK